MEYMYHSRAKGKAKRPHGAESAGPVSGAGNMQLLNAMGADSVSDSGLEAAMGARFSAHFEAGDVIQMKRADEPEHGGPGGGSPADIISDLQQRSGVDLSDVKIHRNSPAPAAIDALAYAKGADVFLGPGQERHLGHELTHVVQQKQGLVRANDSVSGMPVNTSPVLEQAADAMSVSAAPETGFAGEGVVQGVFVDPSGKKVSKSDLKSAKKMLKGSMDSILETAQSSLTSAETKKDRKRIERALKKAKKQVGKRLKKAQKSKDEVDLGSMMTEIMDDAYGQMGFDKSSSMPAQKLAADSGSQQALTAAFPDYNEKLRKKDTQEGLQESMGGFQLPTEAAEGIGDIGEYDPASDKMEELLDARMGNSGTLMAQENETPEHRAAREKSSENFKNGAEAARQGAAAMREDPENISAGGLFQLFSNINENVRGGEGGGALRGKNVTVGQLATPGPAALPEDAYRTFAGIAAQMQEIKKTQDPKLAKTQAVHLAAYAYQMTISEHMFGDGNGRTCRLLADTILQTFGLPPMSPVKELSKTGKAIGTKMDFNAGAEAMMQGVRQSDQTLKAERNRKTSDETMSYRTTAVPANYDPETASDDETLAMLYQLIKNPRPEDDAETISARKRHFAELRAAQQRRQEAGR